MTATIRQLAPGESVRSRLVGTPAVSTVGEGLPLKPDQASSSYPLHPSSFLGEGGHLSDLVASHDERSADSVEHSR
jgi:hypothetical protein